MHLACRVSMPLYQQQEALLKSLCCFQKPPRLNISFNVVLLSFFFSLILSFSTHIFPREKKVHLYYHGGQIRHYEKESVKDFFFLLSVWWCVCVFQKAQFIVSFIRKSSQSVQAHPFPFKVQKILLSLHSWGIQEMVFPKRKSAYSFLRSTRCILKVLGDVFE